MIAKISVAALAVLLATLPLKASTLVYEATFTYTLEHYSWDSFYAYRITPDDQVESIDFEDLFDFPVGESYGGTIRIFSDTLGLYPQTTLTVDFGNSFCLRLCAMFRSFPFNRDYGVYGSFFSGAGTYFSSYYSDMTWAQTLDIGPDGGSYYLAHDMPTWGLTEDGYQWYSYGMNSIYDISNVTVTHPAPVPLPGSGLLFAGLGLLAAGLRRVRDA